MERTGTITAVSGDTLEVTFCRPGDCEKCHACIGGEKKHVLLVKGEGHVGDVAVVSLPEQTVVKASALAYLLPLAGLFIGMLLGALVAPQSETAGSAIGGVIGSVVIGLLATIIYSALSGRFASLTVAVTARHYIIIAAMGAVASVLGILGDLFASAVKRQVGIKDYGTIFPGHGGILDRFDSVMFIAPLVSIVVRYFFYVFQ